MNSIERDAARYRRLKAEHEKPDGLLAVHEYDREDDSSSTVDYDALDAWVDGLSA